MAEEEVKNAEVLSEEAKVEEKASEVPQEEVKEDVVIEEEKPAEEAPVVAEEAPVVEATEEVSAVAEVAPEALEENKPEEKENVESLAKEAKKTEEELAVIKEVRDELVTLYARYKDEMVKVESLTKELDTLKNENAKAVEELSRYREAEDKLNAKLRQERLESLSAKFGKLGQKKTVEELSAKDDATLNEFEMIVDAALDKAGESLEMPSVTVPSATVEAEALSNEEVKVEETKPAVVVKAPEKLSKDQFFKSLLQDIAKTQTGSARNRTVKFY